ncbi:DUF309 domain-containing protein [Thermovibrio ammonificans]
MDYYEIRNWFAHRLCDYLREKEEEPFKELEAAVEAILNKGVQVEPELGESVAEGLPLLEFKGGKLKLKEEELDPITEEILKDKAEHYQRFLSKLPKDFNPVGEDLEANVKMARELFKAELYFEVHELLEEVWMGEFGRLRDFLQALIQVGVAYYHLNNFNERGFKLLLENALELLQGYSGTVLSVNVDNLKNSIKRALETQEVIEF